MSGELPKGWTSCTLGDLLAEMMTGPFGSTLHKSDYVPGGVPVINPTNIVGGRIVASAKVTINRQTFNRLRDYALRTDDIIIARRGEMGRCAVITETESGFLCGTGSAVLRLNEAALPRFVQQLISSESVRKYLSDASVGTTMENLNQRVFKEMPVALPPRAEQLRIVKALEKLLAEVEMCSECIAKVPVQLKRFRKSVLAAGCSGRLTADLRKETPSDLQIDSILASIERRQSLFAKTVAQKEKMRGVFSALEEGSSDDLPDNWRFVRLNKLTKSFNYGTSAKSKPLGKVPVLRMGNLQGGEVDWSDLAYTSDDAEIRQYSLTPQTVLFNRTNSPELVGKTAIYRGKRPAIFAGYLIRINPYAELNPEYLNLCLNTSYAREFCASVKTDGVSQSNINAQKLGTFEVPFCHPAEQQEIVRRVNGLFSLADKIEARFKIVQRQVDRLPHSILAKAFRGELVPTEAELAEREGRDYESAEVLLQRLQASKLREPKAERINHRKAKPQSRQAPHSRQ